MQDIFNLDCNEITIGGKKYRVVKRLPQCSRLGIFTRARIARDPAYKEVIRERNKRTEARRGGRSAYFAKRERAFSKSDGAFVAIDSEGAYVGDWFARDDVLLPLEKFNSCQAKDHRLFRDQRLFLVGASDGKSCHWAKERNI